MTTPTIAPEVRELAAKTAAELRRRGRITKVYYADESAKNDCAVCLLGGIAAAERGMPYGTYLRSRLTSELTPGHALVDEIGRRVGHVRVENWNDDPNTTDEDVLSVLDSIAAES